jgi:ATP-binding cassette subfamily F protein uup
MSIPIYYIKNGALNFGDKTIFQSAELYLYSCDKICLIGRNGSGKSSLLKVISGLYELSSGELYSAPLLEISYLDQNPKLDKQQNIYNFILGQEIQETKYKADIILSQLEIDGNEQLQNLSGGQFRRACLAKTLVSDPQLLLLDEPTNHMDIRMIEWLEDYVKKYQGAVVCISHDRSFLNNVTNKVWWLDRGIINKSDKGFKYFEIWQEELALQEERELQKLNKKMQAENQWLFGGISARRKRNQKRLTALLALRQKLQASRAQALNAKQKIQASLEEAKKTQFIIEAQNISFGYNENKMLVSNFDFRVKKGEKIGIIGPNGTGKTTFLKLLTKQLVPSAGRVKHGANLEISYLEQARQDIKTNLTLQEVLSPSGSYYIEIQDRVIHVASYLKQFMFDPRLLSAKVSILSGGELNRLLLAKLLIKPGSLLILDEPTNDLDMDTIEILLEMLFDYSGTCIIVSHDRDFLNRLVDRSLIFRKDQEVLDIIGGYEDYTKLCLPEAKIAPKKDSCTQHEPKSRELQKLSYKYQRELQNLPQEIYSLEQEIIGLEITLQDGDLFNNNRAKFDFLTKGLQGAKLTLEEKMSRWIELEELNNQFK